MNGAPRIINVSNRLPVKISSEDRNICYQLSEGGLATGLSSIFKQYDNIWLGWPGAVVADEDKQAVTDDLKKQNLHPVFLTQAEIRDYYEGFCNETIWPLFHYFINYSGYSPQSFDCYRSVNEKFANEILKHARKDDVIWIHDYQLMLVPQMIRKALPDVTIGFFLHIPFPAYPVFTTLPWRKELLEGLMGANVVGFQTHDDVRHFTDAANRILDLNFVGNEVKIETGTVVARAFPISIDYHKYSTLAKDPLIQDNEAEIRSLVGGNKMLLSVDRLDYSKGILQRLNAYELFLQQHPEWHGKITFIHLVVPSRDTVKNYKELKEEMDRKIGSINGKYATLNWQPIKHFYRSVSPELLAALYKHADVALVTPLRDGMNLVSKEYVASNVNRNGVLVLSETAGAAKELKDALIINPNDIYAFSAMIFKALNMQSAEKMRRISRMQDAIKNADIFQWAQSFVDVLMELKQAVKPVAARYLTQPHIQHIEVKYSYSVRRLILLDYDGTLVPFHSKPADAVPDKELLKILNKLAGDKHNKVVIISGRDRNTLDKWMGNLPLHFVAEHGAWLKESGKDWQAAKELSEDWKPVYKALLELFTRITPGSFIEEKSYSIAWHYRQCEPELGQLRAAELIDVLEYKAAATGLQLLHGDKVLEVKCAAVNKGKAANKLMNREKYDFIMAIGDDVTDEDMFNALPGGAVTIKVNNNVTSATYFLNNHREVRSLLALLHNTAIHADENVFFQLAG